MNQSFTRGDKVISKLDNNLICIIECQSPITKLYQLNTGGSVVIHRAEQDLKPYIEPKDKEECPYTDGRTCDNCMGKDWKCGYKPKDNMEEKELNLCKILKGHEGETFYSPAFGNVRLDFIDKDYIAVVSDEDATSYKIFANGTYTKNGEICFFPTKDQRDWVKWDRENNHKTPKTWSELVKDNVGKLGALCDYGRADCSFTENDTPIEKSALSLLKIHKLIEVGYGGNISKEAWKDPNYGAWCILYRHDTNKFEIQHSVHLVSLIAFQTKKQAENFLLYSENIQLLKDYYIV